MRCAPGYRHNDITSLIISKPNSNVGLDNMTQGKAEASLHVIKSMKGFGGMQKQR